MMLSKSRIVGIALIIGLLLFIPWVAMQFTDEIQWSTGDFAIVAVALIAVALAYELIARKSDKTAYRVAFGIGLMTALLLFWVNGAVGIIGNEGQPANLLYGVVFVIGLIGSLMARFKPKGMYYTLLTATVVQMLIPVVALLIWPPPETSWSPGIVGVFILTGFFALLFLLSAMLFRRSISS